MQADSLCFQTEKQVKEFGDKVPEEIKTKINEKVASLRSSISSDDLDGMKAGIEALNQVDIWAFLFLTTRRIISLLVLLEQAGDFGAS